MQTNPVWRMVRALIATYILSGILLAILSFALFKFRLPENQVNLAVCAVYILSCFFGGMIAGKTNEDQAFFLGPGPRNSLFSVFISHVPRPEGRCHGRHQKTSLCPRHVHIERNGGRDGELTVSHLREEINNERQNPHHNEDSKHSLPHDP